MLTEPTRYRQRPPEVDALEVTPDTADAVLEWLTANGRDGYRTAAGVRVVEGHNAPRWDAPGLVLPPIDVPWGQHLVRDVATGAWAAVSAEQLAAEYVSAREADRRARGYM